MSEDSPALSIGLAVRNGRNVIDRCIESILSQDFTDFELVICDNASDDGTIEMLNDYARADRRVKLSANQVNIGLHQNMRRVLETSRGRFFRWISADDWLEPRCLSTCVRALENRPDAIAAFLVRSATIRGCHRASSTASPSGIGADRSRGRRHPWSFRRR